MAGEMTPSQDLNPEPIQISIPSSIIAFRVPLSTYFSNSPSYTNLAVGACIFTYQTPARLLLVQRAATERGFPSRWEVPGGSVDATDPTILHGLAREVFEETGLRFTTFVCQVGKGIEFMTGPRRRWMKLSFEIEVQGGADESTEVTLDPAEHQAYQWITKKEVIEWGVDNIVTPEQRDMILLAFEQHDKMKVKRGRC